MKIIRSFSAFTFLTVLLLPGCSGRMDDPLPPGSPGDATSISRIEDILRGKDEDLIFLLNQVRGSVGKRGPGSKTVWSRKNDHQLGLYISASHVYGLSTWSSRNETFIDINAIHNGIFETSKLPLPSGEWDLGNRLIADFTLYHPAISPQATNITLLPAEDFYLGIIDNQRVIGQLFAQTPKVVQKSVPLAMFDPENRTIAPKTWNLPVPGEKALLVGYPQDLVKYPNGAALYAKILTDQEAKQKIVELKAAGDSEGDIPYDADAEFFIEGKALAGMSGGGAFNNQGQCLGIMVRASDKTGAPSIVRVVKTDYIRKKLVNFYQTLPHAEKDKLRPFVSGELAL